MPRKGQFKTHCKRGHERIPENLYPNRTCRLCSLIRNPAKVARILAKQKANPEAHAKRVNDWAKTESGRRSVRNTQLQYKYGITLEQYEEMLKNQENKCAICNILLDSSSKNLVPCVDHVHDDSKRVRDLLCADCNFGLGQFKEDKKILLRAIDYLIKHS